LSVNGLTSPRIRLKRPTKSFSFSNGTISIVFTPPSSTPAI
jgi:hypothetical protein